MTKRIALKKKDYITTLTEYSEELTEQGEESLEVYITTKIAEGVPLLDICKGLNFPAVHILAWLQQDHSDILHASEAIQKDKGYAKLAKDVEIMDAENYRHEKAKADIRLNALKARRLSKKEEQVVATSGGMNFAINVVVPDYAKEETTEVEVVPVED